MTGFGARGVGNAVTSHAKRANDRRDGPCCPGDGPGPWGAGNRSRPSLVRSACGAHDQGSVRCGTTTPWPPSDGGCRLAPMARATAWGRSLAGGRRRPCRRRLPAGFLLTLTLTLLAVALPVSATSPADAWVSARDGNTTRADAIRAAASSFAAGGGDIDDLHRLRSLVGDAVRALDRLEVHDCFRVWWSYVRSSYVMFDVALVGIERGDAVGARSATAASAMLAALADRSRVDCADGAPDVAGRIGPAIGPSVDVAGAIGRISG